MRLAVALSSTLSMAAAAVAFLFPICWSSSDGGHGCAPSPELLTLLVASVVAIPAAARQERRILVALAACAGVFAFVALSGVVSSAAFLVAAAVFGATGLVGRGKSRYPAALAVAGFGATLGLTRVLFWAFEASTRSTATIPAELIGPILLAILAAVLVAARARWPALAVGLVALAIAVWALPRPVAGLLTVRFLEPALWNVAPAAFALAGAVTALFERR